MKFYNIRVIEADNQQQAIEKVTNGEFIETDPLADQVIPSSSILVSPEICAHSYLLLGEEACRILAEDDFETLVSEIENNYIGYAIYHWTGNLPELLSELSGWGDYAFLTEEQYNIIAEL